MKVAVCAIAKLENNYLREWVEHYFNLGFDNIILYDNNDVEGERFDEVIDDYIKNGFVIVENVRGEKDIQIKSYNACYKKYSNDYDWIAFFDIDEFINLKTETNIKDYLASGFFKFYNCIRINWRNFDDNNLIKVENNNYSIDRFSSSIKNDGLVTKCILRTKIAGCKINSTHGPLSFVLVSGELSQNDVCVFACNANGVACKNVKDIYNGDSEFAILNHYRYKTIDEYIRFKVLRGYPEKWAKYGKSFLTVENFFTYNKLSYKKYKYAKLLLKGNANYKVRGYIFSILKRIFFKIDANKRILHHKLYGN